MKAAALAAAFAVIASCAEAEEPLEEDADQDEVWEVTLGPAVGWGPDYEGSDDYDLDLRPHVEITYRELIFLEGPSLGANLISITDPESGGRLLAGPVVRYGGGRDEDGNPALSGLGDVDDSVEIGGFAGYRVGPWSISATILQDVGGGHEGLRGEFGVGYGVELTPDLGARLEVSTTWADGDYMSSYFGVTGPQSAASGLPQHDADGGFKDVGLSLGASWEMFDGWFLSGQIGYARLLGDAADSPIVEDEGSADQVFAASSVTYRF